MTTKNLTINLNGNSSLSLSLSLKNLYARVIVRKGPAGKASVELNGDEKLIELIKVIQPSSNEVLIEGEDGGGDVTVIQNHGRSSISVRGNGVVISGSVRGNIVSGGNVVIVNGKVISGGNGQVTEIAGAEMPTITVTVPEGTELDAESVESLDAQGLNGKLYLSLNGQGQAKVQDANGLKIDCSGQSRAEITNATGNLLPSQSWQSRVTVKGNLDDVDADSSGQSRIQIVGNCHDCEGNASGMSSVSLIGRASGKVRKHESGMSHVEIN